MHYVIGDVHGCFDEMMILINKIEEKDENARFIFVGDLIDRGPKVMSVLNWAMANITQDGKYQSVMGNHEAGVIEWYHEFLVWWKEREAGEDSMPMPETHYDFSQIMEGMNMLTPEKLQPIIHFFTSLSYSKTIEIETIYGKKITYRIVHAAYNYSEDTDSEKQKKCNIWERNYWGYPGNKYNDEIVIHGHTPTIAFDYLLRGYTSDVPGMIGYRQNDINVDGGCCYLHSSWDAPCMLCAICLETLEEIYPYSVEERFVQMWKSTVEYDSEDEYAMKMYYKERAAEFCKRYCEKEQKARKDILVKMGKEAEEKYMAEYPKVKKAKAYKEELHKILKKYLEEKDHIVINSGQLKFFRGLMIRYIAVSINLKIQKPSTRVFEFFDNYVCGSNDEVIDFFDHENNMRAFFESLYCEGSPFSEPFETEYATIPFLLLQKLQNVMEECFRAYLRIDGEEQREKKESAYLDLLLSIALYEIFIRELFAEVEDKLFDENSYEFEGEEDIEALESMWEEIKSCKDLDGQDEKLKILTTHAQQAYEKMYRYSFRFYYIWYFAVRLINLYAVMRIIVLIERVQINKGHGYAKTERGKLAASEAKYWYELMDKILKDGTLFFEVPRKSNLGFMYAQINKVFEKNKIFPYIEKDIKYRDFEKEVISDMDLLKKYLDMIQRHTVFNRTDAEEKMMWDWQAQLAEPLWKAAGDIMEMVGIKGTRYGRSF